MKLRVSTDLVWSRDKAASVPKAQAPDDRREVGQLGEMLAVAHLEAEGFEIIGRNLRRDSGELDVVALDADRLVFVEVRSLRGGVVRPEETVGWSKQRRVAHQARCWLTDHPEMAQGRVVCFDVVGVSLPTRTIRHLRCAFEAESWW